MILVLNLGSSSLKFKVYSQNVNDCLCCGLYERIGCISSNLHIKTKNVDLSFSICLQNHRDAICSMKKILIDEKLGILNDFSEITSIGHRVVHGGDYFEKPVLIDDFVIEKIRELSILAPIHNTINLEGILDCIIEFPNVPQIAVFDTSFFCNLPEKVKKYPIPNELSEKYKIKRYGFHGISHNNVYNNYKKEFLKNDIKVISCHLGNGSSICAIENGKPIDISMGFTPLEGLIMGTRSGSLDPSVVTYLIEKCSLCSNEVEIILNKKSGLLGISEVSSDVRDLINNNDEKCKLAIDMYCYSIVKYIGAYFVSLKGIDAILFTGGIGENFEIREKICNDLKCLDIKIDNNLNKIVSNQSGLVSSKNSKIDIFVSKSDEEFSIAQEVYKYINTQTNSIKVSP